MLVQQMNEVPESLPVTEETRGRLLEQAHQLPQTTVLRLCDLLGDAIRDMRPARSAPATRTGAGQGDPARADLSWTRSRTGSNCSSSAGRAAGAAPATRRETKPARKKKSETVTESAPEPSPRLIHRAASAAEEAPEQSEPAAAADSPSEPISVELQRCRSLAALDRAGDRLHPARSIFQEAHPIALEGSR